MTTTMTAFTIEPLRPGDPDYSVLLGALAAERLPTDDLTEPGRAFIRIEEDGRTVGFGGFELHGEEALLRSVMVLPARRGQGLGRDATETVLRAAAEAGARRAWLLTTTAAPFFERLGFTRTERASAPEAIRSTRQAAQLCPFSAALMVRPLAP